eukprot:gene8135-10351_t
MRGHALPSRLNTRKRDGTRRNCTNFRDHVSWSGPLNDVGGADQIRCPWIDEAHMVSCSSTIKDQVWLVLPLRRKTEVFMEPRSSADSIDAELRAVAASFSRPSVGRSLLQLVTSFGPFLAGCAAMYVACDFSPWLALAFAIPTGAFMVRVFIVQHDCGHGSFFASRRANTIVGRLCSLCTFTPFASWRRQHAQHHAEWNNLDRGDR